MTSAIQVDFPDLEALKAMYWPLARAGRVGSCEGNRQFWRHAITARS